MDADTKDKFERLVSEVELLNSDEKAKLLKKILSDSSIKVIVNECETANTYQFNLDSNEAIASIFSAIAEKLRS